MTLEEFAIVSLKYKDYSYAFHMDGSVEVVFYNGRQSLFDEIHQSFDEDLIAYLKEL